MIEPMVTLDWRSVDEGLRDIARRGANLRPVFAELKPELQAEIQSHFEAQEGPEGPWPQRAASTEARMTKQARMVAKRGSTKRGKLTRRTIRRVGRIFGQPLLGYKFPFQLTFDVERNYLEARNRVKWSAIHDEGGRAGRGGRSNIPRRQFMWASGRFYDRVRDRLLTHVLRGW